MGQGGLRGGHKRSKLEREADLTVTADLYRRGWTFRQIADEITKRRAYSITYSMVKKDLDRVLENWRAQQSLYIDNFVTLQIEQIQAMKRELWSEYIRSKSPTKITQENRKATIHTEAQSLRNPEQLCDIELDYIFEPAIQSKTNKKKPGSELEKVEIHFTDLSQSPETEIDQTVKVTENLGNPKYLELIAKVMEQEARLLGFYNTDSFTPTNSVVIVNMPAPESYVKYLPIDNRDEQ